MIKNKVLDSVGVAVLWEKLKSVFIDESDLEAVVNVIQTAIDEKASTEELNTIMENAKLNGEFDGTSIYYTTATLSTPDEFGDVIQELERDFICAPYDKVIKKGDIIFDRFGTVSMVAYNPDEEWEEGVHTVSPIKGVTLKGQKGESGVFVGIGDMPVGYNVQVDTSGGDGTPILRVRDDAGVTVEIPAIKGDTGMQGEPGQTGPAGHTPIKGTDYFTQSDKDEIVNQTKQSLGAVYKYKGTVEDITALNAIVSPEEGDTYNVTAENGVNFVWTGTEWDAVGQVVSVSNSVITGDANPVSGDAVYSFVQGALALYDDILMGELG